MATGPEHYDQAEKLLEESATALHPSDAARIIAEAQVHATLALAAATAMSAPVEGSEAGMGSPEFAAWYEIAGVKPESKGGERR
uniref:hypothetical protein n=1 Tax=Streptomyces scabiei TaxID=1930 RepID=UPI000E68E71C|nr:hypothetical protein [Streptomyces scabiei]